MKACRWVWGMMKGGVVSEAASMAFRPHDGLLCKSYLRPGAGVETGSIITGILHRRGKDTEVSSRHQRTRELFCAVPQSHKTAAPDGTSSPSVPASDLVHSRKGQGSNPRGHLRATPLSLPASQPFGTTLATWPWEFENSSENKGLNHQIQRANSSKNKTLGGKRPLF